MARSLKRNSSVPLRADGAAPVYIPTAPRAEALTAAEEMDADVTLPTVTVRGFLNFRTTVDGTVIVFTPASVTPQDPTPASSAPSSSAPPGTPISPRNDDIQHLTYTGDDRNTRTELENEAHTPEDDRQNFRQRHLKLGYSDLGTTPHSPKNEEPQQNLHKPDATPQLPQYPTGLVTVLGGTHVKDGATTVFETKVIGTYIEGKYAQILQSTSQIIFPAKSEDLSTPRPSPTKPSFLQKSATLAVTSSRPTPSKSNQILVEHSSSRQKPTAESKEYRSTTPDSREADRRTDEPLNANTVLQSSFKLPDTLPANRHTTRPTQSLEKTLTRSSYRLSRRFRPTLATDVPPEDENTVPESQNARRLPPRFRYVLPRRNTPTVRLNRFKVKLTVRNDDASDLVTPHENTFDPEDDLLEEYDPLHSVDPAKVVYEKTTITSEVTLHVGRRKSVRTLTITTSVPKTRHGFASEAGGFVDAHDISPANNNAIFATLSPLDEDAGPHVVVTRTYTTTERMLKTSVVPVLENDTTSYHTVTESFFILKLITGYKTLPAADMTVLHTEVSDTEFDESPDQLAGLLDGAVQLQPSGRQQIVQTAVPNGLLQASGSGREQAVVPYDQTRSNANDLSNSLLSLGAALQQNPLAAVYLGLQQLNKQATLYSTITKTSTYVHTDTIYSTKVVSFYDGRRTRTRTLSESVSTTLKTMTSLSTTVEPYLNTQLFQQQNQLQQLLGGSQMGGTGPQLLAPPPQYSTVTSTYTTVTTATSLSTRIYTLIYNAISTKFRTVTSTSLYETTITATTTSQVPIAITAPPGGVFPFLG
ncbi:uncharacterized protein LOC129972444 isoform X2 [Argiope bruennichi]|uniref:uncharacterized protein LOC129972444 isoform X2 n=1 Tax=Argiope bruennichi TaxID=94029 RepID=UPI002494BC58|nr:uncharacterized protein LOC129972444 isoform X2 [Argiope bruennichi]